MKALEERILREGTVLPGGVLKVGSFLNQQVDADFMMEMGQEIHRLFASEPVTKILTVEASGIALAMAAAVAFHVPFVFAKKAVTSNLNGQVYSAPVHSFTHNTDCRIFISRAFLSSDDCVLIVDDFLANGEAIRGMTALVEQSGARLAGAAVAVEKGFQPGGDELRRKGVHLESLALVDSMSDTEITFRR